jgi:hypothetical protein
MKDENGRSFGTRLQGRISTIGAALRSSPEYSAQPELSAAIQLQMAAEVEEKSAALRKAGKNPDVLLDPTSKDNYFTPDRIKAVANDIKQRAREMLPQPPRASTQAEYDALPPGPYIDSRGNPGVKPERRKSAPTEPVSERRRAQRGSQETNFPPPPKGPPFL